MDGPAQVSLTAIVLCLVAGSTSRARAQQKPGEPSSLPKFEVVSIKPCINPGHKQDDVSGSPVRLRIECMTVEGLIRNAYLLYTNGVPQHFDPSTGILTPSRPLGQLFQRIKGISGWMQSERFTIDAKADTPASLEMMRGPMLQVVLKDRFKLKLRRETREFSVYELTVDKGGAKLQPAKPGSCEIMDASKGPPPPRARGKGPPPPFCGNFRAAANGGVDIPGVTMATLCTLFSAMAMEHDVIDKTGITGVFDVHLDLNMSDLHRNTNSGPTDQASDPGGSLQTAVRKLGLRLTPGKKAGEFLVVDHVERPTVN
jgi:uncharacterized protein (TIGR03435 family)